MKPTRQRILDYLASRSSATAIELSHGLQVTPSDVRHHLGFLVHEGAILPTGERPIQGRGRPAQRYRLASQERQGKFDLLASALLGESLSGLSPAGQEAFLRHVAARLAGTSPQPVLGEAQGELRAPVEEPSFRLQPSSLSARLVRAVQRLSELGYPSRWEARAEAPRLILERCPYAALLPQHPELRQLEVYLIEALLGVPVTEVTRHELGALGETYCVFVVGK
jgi:predicted ArsR family transcriptional regulator